MELQKHKHGQLQLPQKDKMEDGSSDDTKSEEQTFMGVISNQLANYFNHVIDAISQKRKETGCSSSL